jgi:hypothetical protein
VGTVDNGETIDAQVTKSDRVGVVPRLDQVQHIDRTIASDSIRFSNLLVSDRMFSTSNVIINSDDGRDGDGADDESRGRER